MADAIEVEVAYAEPHRQFLRRITLPAGATVGDAIAASGLESDFGIDASGFETGIWSRPVERNALLANGDRVELYRPLTADPKEARRRRAKSARQR
jgi:putative ubiquitin-RnfH superfamily antitoxin RatB of RatAB toxin-antitoxin module